MDLTRQLIKIRSDENGQHIIEFATTQSAEQLHGHIIEIDTTKLRDSSPTKVLEYNNACSSTDTASTQQSSIIKLNPLPPENIVSEEHTIFLTPINTSNQHDLSNTDIFFGDHQGITHQSLFYKENNSSISSEEQTESLTGVSLESPVMRFGSYADFRASLLEYESQTITKYILRNQTRLFSNEVCLHEILNNEKNASELPLIRWEFCAAKDFLPIPFMGMPYITVGKQVFQCHQGKDYNLIKKQQYELKKEILNQASRLKVKTRDKGPSKKLDCPVLFAVRKMYLFPEYPLKNDSKRNRTLVAQKLRETLLKIKSENCKCKSTNVYQNPQKDVIGKLEYLTRFPSDKIHNHDVSKAANFMKIQLKKLGSKGIEVVQAKKSVGIM